MLAIRLLLLSTFVLAGFAAATVFSELSNLPLDENDRLTEHFLLFAGNEECTQKVNDLELSFRDKAEVTGALKSIFFGEDVNPSCALACLERGVHQEQMPYPIQTQIIQDIDPNGIDYWTNQNCQQAEIGFLSYYEEVLEVRWIRPDTGERMKLSDLRRGERHTSWHNTFLGHSFEIYNPSTDNVIGEYNVIFNAIYPLGSPPPQIFSADPTKIIEATLKTEFDKAHRVKRTFTELGFNRGRLPNHLWGSISAYYYNNRNNKVQEEWIAKGLFVNWWERDVFFIPMPWKIKVTNRTTSLLFSIA